MNANDVESRLEKLAADSANPEMPLAILDRMARLQAGEEKPRRSDAAQIRPPRVRARGAVGSRGVTLLGIAAVLAVIGGAIALGGGNPVRPGPSSPVPESIGPSLQANLLQPGLTPTPESTIAPTLAARPSVSLGPWRQVYTFDSQWTFGNLWGGGPFQPVWLTWQNDEIVGLATRYRDPETQRTCVLQSKDGTRWTCTELPTPTGEACGPGPCPEVTGLAVHDGRWVVVGYSNFESPQLGNGDPGTFLTWTSGDGVHWSVQPRTSTPSGFIPGSRVVGAPAPPVLLATDRGFLVSGCPNGDQPGLRTSSDGLSWQPVTFAPGSMTMTCASLAARSSGGYMASGVCANGEPVSTECVAHSPDGLTWTASNPLVAVPSALAGELRIDQPDGPSYVDGQWIVALEDVAGGPYYEATSADGVNWRFSGVARWQDYPVADPRLGESDYHPPVFSQLASSGYWAINNGPHLTFGSGLPSPGFSLVPEGPTTSWSATGMNWQAVSDAPPGWPVALVETPTALLAFMDVAPGPPSNPITSVWIADKH